MYTQLHADTPINNVIIDAVLSSFVDGFLFEDFVQKLLFNFSFGKIVPIGGIHDGGRDGTTFSNGLNEFIQISLQKTWKAKVYHTLSALQNSGHLESAKRIYYFFPFSIEESARTELQQTIWSQKQINIQINSLEYMRYVINYSQDTRRVFLEFCKEHSVFQAIEVKSAEIFPQNALDKTIVLLRHLVNEDDRSGDDYIETLCKSHMYLYLRDTDPDQNKFKKLDELRDYIRKQLHGLADEVIAKSIASVLTSDGKLSRDEKDFRLYADGNICLSYKIRQQLLSFEAEDTNLLSAFKEEISDKYSSFSPTTKETLVVATTNVLVEIFKRQGLLFVQHINGKSFSAKEEDLKAIVHSVIDKLEVDNMQKGACIAAVSETIYNIVWLPSNTQKDFLLALSKSYSLMFIGKADSQILNYLESTARGLTLLLGTDIIVRALAEILLPPEKQRFTALIRSLKISGVKLSVTDGILREAGAHIRSTTAWYDTYVRPLLEDSQCDSQIQEIIDFEERYSRKVLIRAFYHARVDGKVKTLEEFLNYFVGNNTVRYNTDIFEYFEGQFDITKPSLDIDANDSRFKTLVTLFEKVTHQGHEDHVRTKIATNDAETVHAVYMLRARLPPPSRKQFLLPEPVWWLTAEFKADKLTPEFEQRYTRPPHIHPEVIVGLLANLPELKAHHKQIDQILSGAIGLQMSHWISDDIVSQITLSYEEIRNLSPGKKNQFLGQLLTKLKTSRLKPIRAYLSPKLQSLASDKTYLNKLYLVRANEGPIALWEYIKKNISDSIARVYFFKEGFGSDNLGAISFLKENGFSEDVKGIQAVILDILISDEN